MSEGFPESADLRLGAEDFAGTWSLGRWIEDRAGDSRVQFVGTAEFAFDGDGLIYDERGLMHIPGTAPIRAERRYVWSFGADGRVAVRFADGRPFHDFDPMSARPRAEHHCAPDHYAVEYDFDPWPRWQSVWNVTGPRKALRIVSSFRRA